MKVPQLSADSSARLFLWVATASITLAAFATMAVSTVMPVVTESLHGTHLYPLAFGIPLAGQLISTAVAGPWCDARGPNGSIWVGSLLFLAGLSLSGLAQNMLLFILGRAVMGLGGGALMVAVYVLVGALVPVKRRPRFFAAFAASWALPAVVGPWIAGKLVEVVGTWRIAFLIVVPFVLILMLLFIPLLRLIPPVNHPVGDIAKRLAWASTGAGVGVMTILIFSVTPLVYSRLVILVGLGLVIFCVPRMFPRGTFRLKEGLPAIMASRGTVNAAFVATETFLPLMLQQGRGWSPAESGLVLTAGSVTYAAGSLLQGRVHADRLRQRLPRLGALILALGIVISALGAFAAIPAVVTVIGWAVGGLGLGLTYPALAAMALAAAPESRHGIVSASVQLADALGGAAALAAITSIFHMVAMLHGPWPYLPGPSIALLLALIAALAGSRVGPVPKTGMIPKLPDFR